MSTTPLAVSSWPVALRWRCSDFAGCGGDDAAPATDATRTVTTDKGPVRVPADPQRIVVLSGGLAGFLFALHAPVAATDTRVLGITVDEAGFPVGRSEQAQEQGTRALPAGDLNIEAVAAATPDLILGGGQGSPRSRPRSPTG